MNRRIITALGLCLLAFGCKEEGCTDISACNFSLTAEADDGTCFYQGDECDDGDDNTSNDTVSELCICEGVEGGGGGNGGGGEDVSGCADSTACNFDSAATSDDGSCVYPGDPCNDGSSNTINDAYDANCECVGETLTMGCTDATACNYNSSATSNDGSCVYPGDPCNDGSVNTVNDTYDANCDCVGVDENANQCAINGNGYVDVQYGIFADQYVDECNYQIYLASDPSVATNIQTVSNSYEWNYTEQEISGYGPWVMSVTDSFGDGKGGDDNNPYDGGYAVYCYSNTGDLVTLVYTPFTDGSSSTTEFTLDVYGFQGENGIDN